MRRPLVAVLGVALLGAVEALSGCSSAPAPAPTAQALAPGATVTWALSDPPTQYNPSAAPRATSANAAVLAGVLGSFWRFRPDGTVERNTGFGTFQKISDDPLTIRYTISDRAVWSDGEPIQCDDIALAWLANSGVTGTKGFASQEVARFREMNRPQCGPGDKIFTISYRTPVADWETAFGPGAGWLLPAHVVQREAGLPQPLAAYLDEPASPDLVRAAAFWNTGWALTPGKLRKDLLLSSGPYQIDAWDAGAALTLRPNPRWWGAPPATGTIAIRFMPPDQQVQALGAGEIQVMDPAPDAATVTQLKGLGAGVTVRTGYRFSAEQLTVNVAGSLADRTLRQAFARCVPRRQIADRQVRPVNPDAAILQSRVVYPFQPGYSTIASAGQAYDMVDLDGARRLLAGRKVTVRIGWRADPDQPDPARQDTVNLIRQSCGQAGFTVVDAGTPTFLTRELPGGVFDVALLSWAGSPAVTDAMDLYVTGGAGNVGHYSSPDADRLIGQITREPDAGRRTGMLRDLDALLWQDMPSLPLFAYPALLATSGDVVNVQFNPAATDVAWNVAQWTRV